MMDEKTKKAHHRIKRMVGRRSPNAPHCNATILRGVLGEPCPTLNVAEW